MALSPLFATGINRKGTKQTEQIAAFTAAKTELMRSEWTLDSRSNMGNLSYEIYFPSGYNSDIVTSRKPIIRRLTATFSF
ncbi:hypothetical protein [Sphingorhabdus sp. Alg231-15]|uniref:hypothetical protein n=1 Tax=Sphingorhabdus sp. Alg231-15 TaxID=1922222 RepID=UPI000D557DEF